jgi:hypothetical protein
MHFDAKGSFSDLGVDIQAPPSEARGLASTDTDLQHLAVWY